MKLYISVDMEGLAGITNWKDETEDQARFRKAMNEQVEWVLEGCEKRHQSEARRMAEIRQGQLTSAAVLGKLEAR